MAWRSERGRGRHRRLTQRTQSPFASATDFADDGLERGRTAGVRGVVVSVTLVERPQLALLVEPLTEVAGGGVSLADSKV